MEKHFMHKVSYTSDRGRRSGYLYFYSIIEAATNLAYSRNKPALTNGNWSQDPEKQLARYEKIYNATNEYDKAYFRYVGRIAYIEFEEGDDVNLYDGTYRVQIKCNEIPSKEEICNFLAKQRIAKPGGKTLYCIKEDLKIEKEETNNEKAFEVVNELSKESSQYINVTRKIPELYSTQDYNKLTREKKQGLISIEVSFDFKLCATDEYAEKLLDSRFSKGALFIDEESIKVKEIEIEEEKTSLWHVVFDMLVSSDSKLGKRTLSSNMKKKDSDIGIEVAEYEVLTGSSIKDISVDLAAEKLEQISNERNCINADDIAKFYELNNGANGMFKIMIECYFQSKDQKRFDYQDGKTPFDIMRDNSGLVILDSMTVKEVDYLSR